MVTNDSRAGRLPHCWDRGLLQDAADLSPAVFRRELAGPDLPEVPSVEGREQWDSETTSVEDIRADLGLLVRGEGLEAVP
ncbi:hypothetical protein DPMN_091859 [Dreissena polymorpha]|uniref:Uncharacterized protein n=1 Tax=Dreissena polymorpha TaxID=45954 RepID=A0A9D4L0L1_DREPO|nr:hypothetical protein DPMN_091859 [Dreissena polymorpha]